MSITVAQAGLRVNTVADFTATQVASSVLSAYISGYYAVGVGGFRVRRTASEPSHGWKFRSVDRFTSSGSTHSTNGGWWEGVADAGYVTPNMFGAKQDNSTDDYAAIQGMIDYIEDQTEGVVAGRFHGGTAYYCTQQLSSKRSTRYYCDEAIGFEGQSPCKIRFPEDVSGWRVHNTPTGGGGDPEFVGICLAGAYSTPDLIHGWQIERIVHMKGCGATGFPGNGFNINGASDGAGFDSIVGFADLCEFDHCWSSSNGINGFYGYGADFNVCIFKLCSAVSNVQYGFRGEGFLGNLYLYCHTSANGGINEDVPPFVVYSGKHYAVVPEEKNFFLTDPSTTTPGTDSSVWAEIIAHAVDPPHTWQSGTNYQAGGGYCIFDSLSLMLGCYSEQGQGPNYIKCYRKWASDGNGAYFNVGRQEKVDYPGLLATTPAAPSTTQEEVNVRIGGYPHSSSNAVVFSMNGETSGNWAFELLKADGIAFKNVQIEALSGKPAFIVTGDDSQYTLGVTSKPKQLPFFSKFGLGYAGAGSPTAGIVFEIGSAAPASTEHGLGWVCYNSAPSGGEAFAWRCNTAGTPGTWEPIFGASGTDYTVATLPTPAAALKGARAHVTDATAAAYSVGTAVSGTGGGSNVLPVFCNGSAWVYG